MARHTILIESLAASPGEVVTIGGEEARHALRVKRLRVGDAVALTDGQGLVAEGRVASAGRELGVRIESAGLVGALQPELVMLTATPKGPRLEKMLDMLSQCGVDGWGPLETRLGVVDPGAGKLERMRRVCVESAKQCGRAWVMRIEDGASVESAVAAEAGTMVMMADASGSAPPAIDASVARVRVLVGPEGGWHARELEAAERGGARLVRLGPHQMRIETAAVAGAVAVRALGGAERRV